MSKKNLTIAKYIFIIAALFIVIYLINKFNIFEGYSPQDIKDYINSFGMFAPLMYIIMFTIIPLTLFPDAVLAIAGGMVFGLFKGFIFTMIGAVFGATLSFYISRILGKNFVKRFIKKDLGDFESKLKNNGFIIILLLRLIPLFPFDIISYSAGLSEIRYKDFLLGTVLGTIPGILVYTNLGDKSSCIGSKGFYVSIASLVLLFVFSFFIKRKLSFNDIQKKLDKVDA